MTQRGGRRVTQRKPITAGKGGGGGGDRQPKGITLTDAHQDLDKIIDKAVRDIVHGFNEDPIFWMIYLREQLKVLVRDLLATTGANPDHTTHTEQVAHDLGHFHMT